MFSKTTPGYGTCFSLTFKYVKSTDDVGDTVLEENLKKTTQFHIEVSVRKYL